MAFLPGRLLELNGWMWITPSPWVWMPSGSAALRRLQLGRVMTLVADVDAVGGVPVVAGWRSGAASSAVALFSLRAYEDHEREPEHERRRRWRSGTRGSRCCGPCRRRRRGGASDLLGGGCLAHRVDANRLTRASSPATSSASRPCDAGRSSANRASYGLGDGGRRRPALDEAPAGGAHRGAPRRDRRPGRQRLGEGLGVVGRHRQPAPACSTMRATSVPGSTLATSGRPAARIE